MKVLMVLDEEFPPDGRVEREINILMDAGHEVHLLCYSLTGRQAYEKVKGIKVYRVAIPKITYKFKALALLFPGYFNFWRDQLMAQLKEFNYDILHFHDLNLAKVCIEAARKSGIKLIGDYHENKPEIMKRYHHVRTFPGNVLISVRKWHNFQIKYSSLLDHLILVTEEARDYYDEVYGVAKNKITVIENFPDLTQFSSFVADETIVRKYDNKRMIVYFGDTGLRRGTDTIIKAAHILRDRPVYHFVIIGTSREQQKLIDLKTKYQLENVELTGKMPQEKAFSYFQAAWAGLCPFRRNIHHDTTYANKLFQYMGFYKPVIVSDCTSQVNVIQESECGLIHQAADASELAEKILMLEDRSLYEKLAKNAGESVRIKYNTAFPKKKLLKLYESLSDEI